MKNAVDAVAAVVAVGDERSENEEEGLKMQVAVVLSGEEAIDGEMFVAGEMVIVLTAGAGTGGWKRLYQDRD